MCTLDEKKGLPIGKQYRTDMARKDFISNIAAVEMWHFVVVAHFVAPMVARLCSLSD